MTSRDRVYLSEHTTSGALGSVWVAESGEYAPIERTIPEETAVAGVRILAAISARSALALRKVQASGMTLVGIVREDSFIAFTGGERLGLKEQIYG
jgi:hypothetical protein